VTAVVNLRAEFDDKNVGIAPAHYLHLPTTDDSPPTLEQLGTGVAFIAAEVETGGVYVHCGSGVGRAATMGAAYLVHTGLSPEEAWARIRQARPFIRPTAVQIEQIERFFVQRSAQCPSSPLPIRPAASSLP
jgi:protein-tyrosine phosphatase